MEKTAFITGGSSGIGLGIARACAEAGMRVAISYRTEKHAEEAMAYLRQVNSDIVSIRVDVRDREELAKAAEHLERQFGQIDLLVANAGTQQVKPLSLLDPLDWDDTIATNLTGAFNTVQAFLPLVERSPFGHIAITASMLGQVCIGTEGGAYVASKFGAVGLAEALATELAVKSIKVTAICPGLVRSRIEPRMEENPLGADPLEVGREILSKIEQGTLYCFSDNAARDLIAARSATLANAVAAAPDAPEGSTEAYSRILDRSIYRMPPT